MSAPADSSLDRIRRHLVGLKMPRALESLHHTLERIERGGNVTGKCGVESLGL